MATHNHSSVLRAVVLGGVVIGARWAARHRHSQDDRRSGRTRRSRGYAHASRPFAADERYDDRGPGERDARDDAAGSAFHAFFSAGDGRGGQNDATELARGLLWILDRTEAARGSLRDALSRVVSDEAPQREPRPTGGSAWV